MLNKQLLDRPETGQSEMAFTAVSLRPRQDRIQRSDIARADQKALLNNRQPQQPVSVANFDFKPAAPVIPVAHDQKVDRGIVSGET